ncbi:Limkain-b1, partial [Ophiophagus hannah]
ACHTLLYVYNLPTNRDSKSICLRLRRLSDNCGGKVLTVSGSSATLRFLSQDSAERAQKRMENEDVFGNRITVSFTPKNRELAETKNSGSSVAEKAKSPKKANRNAKLCLMSRTANDTSSTTKGAGSKGPQGHGPIPKNTAVKSLQNSLTVLQRKKRIQWCPMLFLNALLSFYSSEAISILQDAPACCLPLSKFTEIYEKKFGHKLNASDLHKLTDILAIRDQGNGWQVCLLPSSQARQSPLGSSQSHEGSSANCSPVIFEELEYHEPVCKRHCVNKDFSEHDFDPDSYKIPFVIHSLKAFAPQVHSLLQTHEGTVPLLSLEMVPEGHGGVPLEHLISCVPGVNIATAQNGIKVVKWIHNKPPPPTTEPWLLRSKSPVGNPQLIQFSRDVIDLLKSQPSCIMSVSKFIPMYHHHFAKQCRVSDYGYSKLIELLESVPHVLQILGIGTKRLLTLTHRAQVKRFTQDLLKLVKSQASKRVVVKEFLHAYHWCFSKDWDVTEYGVCELNVPRKKLKGRSSSVLECGEEKILTLTETEQVKALAAQFVKLLRSQKDKCLLMADVLAEYAKTFGYPLRLQDYDVGSVPALMQKLCHVIKVANTDSGKQLQLINKKPLRTLTSHLLVLLMTLDEATVVSVKELKRRYEVVQGTVLNPCEYGFMTFIELLMSVPYFIELTDLYVFAKKVRLLLHTYHYQQIFLHEFPTAYSKYTGEALHPDTYGFNNLEELLGAIPSVVWIKGHGHKKIVVLKNDMKTRFSSPSLPLADESYENELADVDGQSTKAAGVDKSLDLILEAPNVVSHQTEEELLCLTNVSPVDLLCEPVPSCLPSPQLRPDPVVLESTDLIRFEEHSPIPSEANKEISHFSEASKATENISALPCSSSEQPACRKATDSPARKQPKSRVKLAANFSFAPVTKL